MNKTWASVSGDERFIVVRTYEDMQLLFDSWADHRKPKSLCIVGTPGVGKSNFHEEKFAGREDGCDYHYFKGRSSALDCYKQTKESPDAPVVFDDIRALLRDNSSIDYLKALCQTSKRNEVCWKTDAIKDRNEKKYISTAPVLIILNWIPREDEDVNAILDRCLVVHFKPTQVEIVRRMKLFCRCRRNVDFLAGLPMKKTLRHLKIYEELRSSPIIKQKKAQALFLAQAKSDNDVKTIIHIMSSKTKPNWIDTFVEQYDGNDAAAKRQYSRKQAEASEILEAMNGNPTRCDCGGCRRRSKTAVESKTPKSVSFCPSPAKKKGRGRPRKKAPTNIKDLY